MRRTTLALLAALLATSTSVAEESDAEATYYRAFYRERALRDFAGAIETYREALKAVDRDIPLARNTGEGSRRKRLSDLNRLRGQCYLGLGRCLKTVGQLKEARTVLEEALRLDPKNVEARALLEGDATAAPFDIELEQRLRGLVVQLASANRQQVEADLVLAGERAIPFLAEGLRSRNVGIVRGAAAALARMRPPESKVVLAKAFADERVVFPEALVTSLVSLVHGEASLAVIEAAFARAEPELRLRAMTNFVGRIGTMTTKTTADEVTRILERVASDPDPRMHGVLLQHIVWPETVLAPVQRVALDALVDEKPSARIQAIGVLKRNPPLLRESAEALLRSLAEDDAAEVRKAALEALWHAVQRQTASGRTWVQVVGEETRHRAILRALGDESMDVVVSAVSRYRLDTAEGARAAIAALERAADQGEIHPRWRHLQNVLPIRLGEHAEALLGLLARTLPAESPPSRSSRRPRGPNPLQVGSDLANYLLSRSESESLDALVVRGLELLPSTWRQLFWLSRAIGYGHSRGSPLPRALSIAAASDDPAIRQMAYLGFGEQTGRKTHYEPPDLPHLARDLADETCHHEKDPHLGRYDSRSVGQAVFAVVARHPHEKYAGALRERLRAAPAGEQYQLLAALAACAGKDAVPDVRAALSSEAVSYTAMKLLIQLLDSEAAPEAVAYAVKHESGTRPLQGHWNWAQGKNVDGTFWRRRDVRLSRAFIDAYLEALPAELVSAELVGITAEKASVGPRRKMLLAGLESKSASTVRASAEQAGVYNLTEAWPRLVALLDRPQVEVRQAAKGALEEIRSYRELRAAFEAFGRESKEEAFVKAKTLLGHADPQKRRAGALALGALGDPAAVSALLDLLDDPDGAVRKAALSVLEKLGGVDRD